MQTMWHRFLSTFIICFVVASFLHVEGTAQKLPAIVQSKIPSNMKVGAVFSGFLDSGNTRDYCIVLQSRVDSGSNPRPLLVSLNDTQFFYNEHIIFGFGYEKYYNALEKISIKNGRIYVGQYVSGTLGPGANMLYYIFEYRNGEIYLISERIYNHLAKKKYKTLPIKRKRFDEFNYNLD